MVKQYPSFRCFTVSITGGVVWFVPTVKVVERGDATGVAGLFKYYCLTVNSVKLYCVSGENDKVVNTCGSSLKWLKNIRKLYLQQNKSSS
jgi:hypothetical protein